MLGLDSTIGTHNVYFPLLFLFLGLAPKYIIYTALYYNDNV